ncbi:class I adenylate-forming enzyme family protein [Terrihabitans rhizophilus]|uniref:AMP-binding protein n=1 Tax=Terrihabitans rhizophilus TaxID=3092662 RepID=A0ABU4RSB3_9HYPH|nr:AMP-binding protein [Terrihabitans sp. PJ23]MDX6805651.1 AMP-binding protein [Terrihabitans sp. PJ23]
MNLLAPLARHAAERPDAPAFFAEGLEPMNWSALHDLVGRLGAALAREAPGDGAVALDLGGVGCALLFLASVAAGREAVVMDPAWPEARTGDVLAALQPAVKLSQRGPPVIDVAGLPPEPDAADVLDAFGCRDSVRIANLSDDADFYIGFTSGTTGMPKGFRRSHGSWLASFAGLHAEFAIGPADRVMALGPFSQSTAVFALAHAVHCGAGSIIPDGFRPGAAARRAGALEATVIYGTPSHLHLMAQAVESGAAQPMPGVRLILFGGAPSLDKESGALARAFPNASMCGFYGAAELSFVALARSDEPVPHGSVGRAFPGVEITIRDGAGRPVPDGERGFVFAQSGQAFSGYALGQGRLLRAGAALSVGDVGWLDDAGFLHLAGRADRMLVIAGRNVHPEEVEQVLSACVGVAEAVVLGSPGQGGNIRLIALVSVTDGADLRSSQLFAELRAHLPAFMLPRQFAVPPHWPRSPSGKADILSLEALWASGECRVLP